MNFNSQICTTKEQSERLITLGLKKETSDCQHLAYTKDSKGNTIPKRSQKWVTRIGTDESIQVCGLMSATFIPAWSLHRLIEIIPNKIVVDECHLIFCVSQNIVYYADDEYAEVFKAFDGDLYQKIINCIEWLIKEGHFNKEYLKNN